MWLGMSSISNLLEDACPQPPEQAQAWSLAGYYHLYGTPTGRNSGSIWWTGASNLFYWVDPKRGLAGMIASQIVPFTGMYDVHGTVPVCQSWARLTDFGLADPIVVSTWAEVETILNSAFTASDE
jgi:CubicO group peptidase (beta-lactamase class C family)